LQNPSALLHLTQSGRAPCHRRGNDRRTARRGSPADGAGVALPLQHRVAVGERDPVDLLVALAALPRAVARTLPVAKRLVALPFPPPALANLVLVRLAIAALGGAHLGSIVGIFRIPFLVPRALTEQLSAHRQVGSAAQRRARNRHAEARRPAPKRRARRKAHMFDVPEWVVAEPAGPSAAPRRKNSRPTARGLPPARRSTYSLE